jgi:hypothetical protein
MTTKNEDKVCVRECLIALLELVRSKEFRNANREDVAKDIAWRVRVMLEADYI